MNEGRGEKGQCDLVCGAPWNDWGNGGYVDVLFTCGVCSSTLFGVGLHALNFLHFSLSVIQ